LHEEKEINMAKIVDVEGIGTKYADKLKKIGINTTDALLKAGATPKARKELAEKTGIGDALILKWVNHVDLYRIKGVGSEYSELLEAAGVDTIPELAQRKAANLTQKMVAVNLEKKLVRKLPVESQVTDWIEQAKKLPRVLTY
jgi:predicted flap endonuclease-1-like 5' DNA nuclease